jgi:hypothetical protein
VQRIAAYPRVEVSADGTGVVSHVGSRLLADVAAAAGLAEVFDEAAGGRRKRCSAHAPGRVLSDLAVLLADGGQTITDLAVLRHQPGLFGPVASTATAWRVLDSVDDSVLAGLKRARARARERAWLLRGEAGRLVPTVRCGGVEVPGLVIDFDASWSPAIRRMSRRPRPSRRATAITGCWCGWTTPARRWPGCCDPGTPAATPPPITSG